VGWQKSDYNAWSARLLDEQVAFVTPSAHHGRANARFAVLNPRTTIDDLTMILDTMADAPAASMSASASASASVSVSASQVAPAGELR
jgi:hypothetical protein